LNALARCLAALLVRFFPAFCHWPKILAKILEIELFANNFVKNGSEKEAIP
jgi:hypothetical protein